MRDVLHERQLQHGLLLMLNGFSDWFSSAKKGERYTYHTGDLAFDRYVPLAREPTPEKRELGLLADMAYELYVQREVLLVQKKIDFKVYEYQAVKI